MENPLGVRIGPDGSVYIIEFGQPTLRKIGTDGIIRNWVTLTGFDMQANDLAFGPDGAGYIFAGESVETAVTVVRVDPTGTMKTIAGSDPTFCGYSGDNGFAAQAQICGQGLAVAPDGVIYLADRSSVRIRTIGSALTSFQGTSNIVLPSTDGLQNYVFDPTGRHLQTLDARTGPARERQPFR